jgi:hypothetical protein
MVVGGLGCLRSLGEGRHFCCLLWVFFDGGDLVCVIVDLMAWW